MLLQGTVLGRETRVKGRVRDKLKKMEKSKIRTATQDDSTEVGNKKKRKRKQKRQKSRNFYNKIH